MHLGRLCLYILLAIVLSSSQTFSQSSGFGSDLDIILDDDVSATKKPSVKSQVPQYDEEFKSGVVTEEQKLDQDIKDSQVNDPSQDAEEGITREEVPVQKSNPTLEDELKNVEKNSNSLPEETEDQMNFGNAPEVQTPPPVVEEKITPEPQDTEKSLEQKQSEMEEKLEDVYDEDLQQADQPEEPGIQQSIESFEEEQAITQEPEPYIPREPKPQRAFVPFTPDKPERSYSREELQRLSEETNVNVEEEDYVSGTSLQQRSTYLKSFKERRPTWTFEFEAFYSQFEPLNFISADGTSFDIAYEAADIPLSGMGLDIKRNFSFGAIALGASIGYYSADTTYVDANNTFTIYAPSVRLTLFLDNLFEEPYMVPYVTGGYTYFIYEESFDDGINPIETIGGETDNFYVGFGALVQLDWLDKDADASAFNSGLQNTFVFLEGRMYMDQGIIRKELDPDFSTGLYLAGGLRLEF